MANNFPNNPILEPGLSVRIIDGSSSQTNDTLYFIGPEIATPGPVGPVPPK